MRCLGAWLWRMLLVELGCLVLAKTTQSKALELLRTLEVDVCVQILENWTESSVCHAKLTFGRGLTSRAAMHVTSRAGDGTAFQKGWVHRMFYPIHPKYHVDFNMTGRYQKQELLRWEMLMVAWKAFPNHEPYGCRPGRLHCLVEHAQKYRLKSRKWPDPTKNPRSAP